METGKTGKIGKSGKIDKPTKGLSPGGTHPGGSLPGGAPQGGAPQGGAPQGGAPVIELLGVTVRFGHRTALENITLSIPAGSQIAIIGPNGAGKSTLLRTMLGLIRPAAGVVRLFGLPPVKRRSAAAFIPQRETVDWSFPVTVRDVVMMGRIGHIGAIGLWLHPGPADREAVRRALDRLGLTPYAGRAISELSGGWQQRVFLARTLAQEAPLLLLDEPFNEIDAGTRQLLLELLDSFVAEGRSVLVATHDLELARERFRRVLLLNKKILADGRPEEIFQPKLLQEAFSGQVVTLESAGKTAIFVNKPPTSVGKHVEK